MALNDFGRSRNLKATALTAGAGELSISLPTAAFSGRAPLQVAVQNIDAANPGQVSFVQGGPYARVFPSSTLQLGAVGPGDRSTLYYQRAGAVDVNLILIVWS